MQLKQFCTSIFITACCFQASANFSGDKDGLPSKISYADTVQIYSYSTKKNHVRLSPNPTTNGTVTIHSNTNETLDFYVFDLEGTLLYRIELKGRSEKTIRDLKKGSYAYDVFKNDESIEQGKIIVK